MKNKQMISFSSLDKKVPTLYVGNLDYKMSQSNIKKIFSKYGKVALVEVMKHKDTNQNLGTAFIKMTNTISTNKCLSELNGKEIEGRRINVRIANERNTTTKKSSSRPVKKSESDKDSIIAAKKKRRARPLDFLKAKKR